MARGQKSPPPRATQDRKSPGIIGLRFVKKMKLLLFVKKRKNIRKAMITPGGRVMMSIKMSQQASEIRSQTKGKEEDDFQNENAHNIFKTVRKATESDDSQK